ncbi:2Fe-2S iron-sulfur cluster binding domain-containing protein [Tautonia sociabilis]|uniref:2Fe-2S iron-sulfur cluster binding domain-containing protein n=1 Tax=Tautonia sociabilis TaxID=2080755 RepID=A0A432MJA4_9BACT|nr:2Fe-2S iron-sulfur cluster binding domain-containing protein [Tautonia sociabilis]
MPRTPTGGGPGEPRRVPAEPDRPLLGVLRDELGLTGSKYGCGEGQCDACSVIVDSIAWRTSWRRPSRGLAGRGRPPLSRAGGLAWRAGGRRAGSSPRSPRWRSTRRRAMSRSSGP